MAKYIQHQLFYPHPPELVWEYITDADLLAQWIMKNDFKPIVGHEFNFIAKPMPDMDFDGIFYCKVLEVVPYKKLSYSWNFGPGPGEPVTESVVNWTLTPKDNGTELLLQHRDFKGTNFMAMFDSMNKGWLELINKMLKTINAATDGTTKA